MNRWYQIRRLRGAIFLILLGVLALLNQWHVFRWHVSWPLLLIAWGLLIVAERTAWMAEVRAQQAAQGFGDPAGASSWSAPPSTGTGMGPVVPTQSPAPENSGRLEDFNREDR